MQEIIESAAAQEITLPPGLADRMVTNTRAMGAYRASTVIDLELGRPMELESMFFEPLRRAQAAGAAVLAHYQTIHFVQPNSTGSEPRVMVYFRVTSAARPSGAQTRLDALTPEGLFLEWPGVAALPP